MPKVTVDGIEVKVKENATILDAAKMAGIWIPTLCYSPVVEPSGSCRICMVEIERNGRRRMVTSCNYPVRRDLTVFVNSDAAVKARQGVMKLLLARSPESEELKSMARRMGVLSTPYPSVTESQRSCILCGLCIQVCEEVIGASAIGFTGRGVNKIVSTPFKMASDECIACGACAAICPVGTIQVRIHEDTGEAEISPFKSKVKLLECDGCGKRLVTEPVSRKALERVDFDWEEFRKRVRLCPDCRRKESAEAMSLIQAKKIENKNYINLALKE